MGTTTPALAEDSLETSFAARRGRTGCSTLGRSQPAAGRRASRPRTARPIRPPPRARGRPPTRRAPLRSPRPPPARPAPGGCRRGTGGEAAAATWERRGPAPRRRLRRGRPAHPARGGRGRFRGQTREPGLRRRLALPVRTLPGRIYVAGARGGGGGRGRRGEGGGDGGAVAPLSFLQPGAPRGAARRGWRQPGRAPCAEAPSRAANKEPPPAALRVGSGARPRRGEGPPPRTPPPTPPPGPPAVPSPLPLPARLRRRHLPRRGEGARGPRDGGGGWSGRRWCPPLPPALCVRGSARCALA